MRKKELIKKVEQIIDSMNSLQRELQIERQENKELKTEIENLKIKLSAEKEKNAQLSAPSKVQEVASQKNEGFVVNTSDMSNDTVIDEPTKPVAVVAEAPKEKAETPTESPEDSDALKQGSIAIGTIVQESVKYTTVISASSSENKKELLSLIMGKGEMAKAEIFSIVESDATIETKCDLIDSIVKDTLDYFKSVAGQI
ncbi:MAG: hypothetical protein UIG59_06275 [Acutalibacteraceae bacterium]|nr:hypothetical protein [Acutalibacteraceae bacterium]